MPIYKVVRRGYIYKGVGISQGSYIELPDGLDDEIKVENPPYLEKASKAAAEREGASVRDAAEIRRAEALPASMMGSDPAGEPNDELAARPKK